MIIRKIRRYRYIPIHLVHRYPAHIFLPQATCSRQPEQQWQTAASTVPHDIRARPVCQFFLKTAERRLLFLIPILHQTTTGYFAWRYVERLFLIPILHQTTTTMRGWRAMRGCSSFQFYIKPQRAGWRRAGRHRCSSFQFYIKPQRLVALLRIARCCSSFQFYIKPQQF